jgi:hypothetical protein
VRERCGESEMKKNEERRMKSEERGREGGEREATGEAGPVSVTTCSSGSYFESHSTVPCPHIRSEWDDLKIDRVTVCLCSTLISESRNGSRNS